MVQKKMSKTSISLKKSKINLQSNNNINSGNKPAGKIWCDLLKYIYSSQSI